MDEQQIRELEIAAAKVMGAEVYFWCGWVYSIGGRQIKCESESLPNCWSNLSETEQTQWVNRVFRDFTPQYARDPAAKWEALEWLVSQPPTMTISKGGYYCILTKDKTLGHSGESLGIAVLKAIITIQDSKT